MELASKYAPNEVELKWYKYWLENNLFASVPDGRKPYSIVIPPPNVTGVLHMGHMLNNTLQDILVRRARMLNLNACWVPGTDHASIATEAKVVAKLAAKGIKKTDLTQEEFLKEAWAWTDEHGGIILEQLKRLGASCDWSRTAFTMDKERSKSVIEVFCDLYQKGLIYRGVRVVNWDPVALTALSDEEVIYKEQNGKLYYLRYQVKDEPNKYIIVATTRPETIFGDSAVCINPNDKRYKWLIGKKVIIPIVGRVVPIIEDEYVDVEFGTGCLKVTPAHDVNDYVLGEKHRLESIDIFNDNGTLNHHGGAYQAMDRFEVRKKIETDLIEAGLMEKVEDYTNKVGHSERTNAPIEPKLSMQWFLKMDTLSKPALEAVMTDKIKLHPEKFKNTYRHWMENVKDWCISRQLWWGHRIPAYFMPDGNVIVASTKDEALAKAKEIDPNIQADNLQQDPDCLDTWFSSWLWPITVFGEVFDKDNKDLAYYYPTADLVTAPDILFFWVARMIMAGYEYRGELPFHNVYLTGIVRDHLGRKMSKSLGNSPDPINLIDKYGADAVRMGLIMAAPAGNDIFYDEGLCEQGRNFCNKIWNSFRLLQTWTVDELETPEVCRIAIKWFSNQLADIREKMDDLFSKYRLSEALTMIYKCFWDDLSATYLELIKPTFGKPIDATTYQKTMEFFEELLQLLHPFMPFITEELWQAIKERKNGESLMTSLLKPYEPADQTYIQHFNQRMEIVKNVRAIRASKNIPQKESLDLEVPSGFDHQIDEAMIKLAGLGNIFEKSEKTSGAVTFILGTDEFAVPIGNFINIGEEIVKLEAELSYQQKFLSSVVSKLSNERFVSKAPENIVAIERKKQQDAEARIKSIQEMLQRYQSK